MNQISVSEIMKSLDLEIVFKTLVLENFKIKKIKVQKILFELITEGCFINNENIHVIGKEELEYLSGENAEIQYQKIKNYFRNVSKIIIFAEDIEIPAYFLEITQKNNFEGIIFKSILSVQDIIKKTKKLFKEKLQEEIIIEDVLFLEIFGMGVLITGNASIRNSLALELMNRRHSFISNSSVKALNYSGGELLGENTITDYDKYILKMSNGVKFDILKNFGIALGRVNKRIDMILVLENWSPKKKFERLGLDEEYENILGVNIPKMKIPVKKGRSLSVIVEAVALNHRLKSFGENSSKIFFDETKKLIGRNKMKSQNKVNSKSHLITNFEEIVRAKKISNTNSELYINNPELYFPIFEFSQLNKKDFNKFFHIIDEDICEQISKNKKEDREKILEEYFKNEISGILIKNDCDLKEEIIQRCEKNNINLYESKENFHHTIGLIEELFELEFSEKTTVHGVLMEIYGLGVLVIGKSGVGKSETGLELVTRGHRLIADDRVKVILNTDKILRGFSGEVPYFMELRGMGIINIRSLYGIGAVKESKTINMVVEIIEDESNEFIREEKILTESILGVEIIKKVIYINTGRNTATLVEAVALDYKSKRLEIGGKD
ncbi:MAG: hypothetical protein KBF12_08980 [Sebaldella sp.]|nr:hypothetical protein [Sebaldella sp.]